MRITSWGWLVLAMVACGGAVPPNGPAPGGVPVLEHEAGAPSADPSRQAVVPNEIIVRLSRPMDEEELSQRLGVQGIEVIRQLSGLNIWLLRVPETDPSNAVQRLQLESWVEYAEPNLQYQIDGPGIE